MTTDEVLDAIRDMITRGSPTPWGPAQHVTEYPNGLTFVSTAEHGGFHVPAELLDRIPDAAQADAERWSGSRNWFEEDCCSAHVVAAFPETFDAARVQWSKEFNKSRGF